MRAIIRRKFRYGDEWITELSSTKEVPYFKGSTIKIEESYSERQLKFVHAMFGDIADQTGYTKNEVKDMLKKKAEVDSVATIDAEGMDRLIDITLEFVKENDITLNVKTVEQMEAEQHVDLCVYKKVCLICGKPADTHHVDKIGMGRERKAVDKANPNLKKLPLCREHHSELHSTDTYTFRNLYHLGDGYKKYFERTLYGE